MEIELNASPSVYSAACMNDSIDVENTFNETRTLIRFKLQIHFLLVNKGDGFRKFCRDAVATQILKHILKSQLMEKRPAKIERLA